MYKFSTIERWLMIVYSLHRIAIYYIETPHLNLKASEKLLATIIYPIVVIFCVTLEFIVAAFFYVGFWFAVVFVAVGLNYGFDFWGNINALITFIAAYSFFTAIHFFVAHRVYQYIKQIDYYKYRDGSDAKLLRFLKEAVK